MHAFDVLGDPVRRRILELLADGERTAGAVSAVVQEEFGISQPAVSQHLRVLRDNGFVVARPEGARRMYAVRHDPLRDVDAWLDRFRRFWTPHLEALATELARGRRERRRAAGSGGSSDMDDTADSEGTDETDTDTDDRGADDTGGSADAPDGTGSGTGAGDCPGTGEDAPGRLDTTRRTT